MTTLTFDTHAFIKRLIAAGMPEPQAETVTALVKEAQDASCGDLVSKADIMALRSDIRVELADTKAEIMKWTIGLALAQVGLLIGILVKLTGGH